MTTILFDNTLRYDMTLYEKIFIDFHIRFALRQGIPRGHIELNRPTRDS